MADDDRPKGHAAIIKFASGILTIIGTVAGAVWLVASQMMDRVEENYETMIERIEENYDQTQALCSARNAELMGLYETCIDKLYSQLERNTPTESELWRSMMEFLPFVPDPNEEEP